MARGMVVGEKVVSQANTDAFRAEHDRIFGGKRAERGTWVVDPATGKLVSADEYVPSAPTGRVPVFTDRYMEGVTAPDGTDIGSRQKRKRWMQATGTVDYSDTKGLRERAAAEKAARARGEVKKDPALREFIGRELYKRKIIL